MIKKKFKASKICLGFFENNFVNFFVFFIIISYDKEKDAKKYC